MKRICPCRLAPFMALLIVLALAAACTVRLPGPIGPATKAPTPLPPAGKSLPAPTKAIVTTAQALATAAPTSVPTAAGQPITTTAPITAALEGPIWQMVSYLDSAGQITPALADSEVTIQFLDGKLAGKDGCNQYTGTYKTAGSVLTIRLGASTLMACEPKLMEQAKGYAAALSSSATYRITGDRLQITNGGGKVALTFVRLAAVAAPAPGVTATQAPTRTVQITGVTTATVPLEGTAWQLTALTDGKGAAPPLAGTAITALFQGGRVTGSAGCNNYAAPYKFTATSLTVTAPAVTTRKACPQPTMRQESAYLSALAKTAAYQIAGDKLELRNAAGALLASFAAAKGAAGAALPAPTKAVTPTIAAAPTRAITPTVTPTIAPTTASAQLTDTQWQWVRFVTPLEVKEIPTPARYALVFRADGKIEITADCNRATGAYKLQGSRIQVQVGAVTRAACPAGSLSEQFLANIGSAVLYFFDGDALYVELFADSGVMKFKSAGPAR